VDGRQLAVFGQVNDALTADMRLAHPLFLALVELDRLFATPAAPRRFEPLPQFPATVRDISLVAPGSVSNHQVIEVIRQAKCPWLESVALFDVFEDEAALGKGKRSLAYSLTYRHPDRTLKDEEVNETHETIRGRLAKELPVELR
jgi:phenylalanyl-tRNA synthetase beta chain